MVHAVVHVWSGGDSSTCRRLQVNLELPSAQGSCPGLAFARFPAQLTLSCFSHRGRESDSDQQSFRTDETADGLAPRFFFVLYEHSMPLRFELPSCLLDVVNVKLKPSVWSGDLVGPGILTKARLRYLR